MGLMNITKICLQYTLGDSLILEANESYVIDQLKNHVSKLSHTWNI